ncbi:DUF4262 domain-containing protein [Micromonospora sp. NPDC049903]|uniref:DUF4262 domain-containing protein n=1 Tax=Micromonospora sp. NPDC049903 TaxID=3364276 RepID=UPI0037A7E556
MSGEPDEGPFDRPSFGKEDEALLADGFDFAERQEHILETTGWTVTHILPGDGDFETTAPFAYPVGLTAHGHPDLITAPLPPEVAHTLLNDLAQRVYYKAERFTHGQRISDLIVGYDAIIIDGPPTDDLHPGTAIARYGHDQIRLQQLVWPDKKGRFPWNSGYDFEPRAQPLIAHL